MQNTSKAHPACQQATLVQRAEDHARHALGEEAARLLSSTERLELYQERILDESGDFLAGQHDPGHGGFDAVPEAYSTWL